MYDSLVIGMGPAGIGCAIYLKRYGLNVLVIGKDTGATSKAHLIENYYGIESIEGKDLINNGIIQAIKLGVNVNRDEVLNIEWYGEFFKVTTLKGTYDSKTIFIATGMVRNSLPILKKYDGNGVSYCATCDGFFYKNKKIAIIGSNEYMLHELNHLSNLSNDVIVFTNGEELSVSLDKKYKVVKGKIAQPIEIEGRLKGFIVDDNEYNFDGCFVAIGSLNASSISKQMGIEMEGNNIKVDKNFMTNIKGVFAGGDVIGGMPQIVKAASDGAQAAMAIKNLIKGIVKK